jgi:hypothetical protein
MSGLSMRSVSLFLVFGASATSLAAQAGSPRTHTTGLLAGFGVEANVISAQPGSVSSSNRHVQGTGIMLGYGVTPAWAVYLNAGWGDFLTSAGNTTVSGSVDLGARYHFRPLAGVLVPFLQGGLSNRAFSQDVPSSVRPPTVNLMSSRYLPALGGGLNVYLTPSVALSGSGMWSASSKGLASPRLHLGLLLSPGAWRR